LEALRASVERRSRGGTARRSSRGDGGNRLARLSKDELDERARKAKISGRSKMTKDELVEALKAA
jgi:hypothetical protein